MERSRKWTDRLLRERVEPVPARELYAGDHWSIARELIDLGTAKRNISVWIISAGYGLVRLDEALKPYSVTFSRRNPDSVVPDDDRGTTSQAPAQWWRAMTSAVIGITGPRSLVDLAEACPQTPLLVVASTTYLNAVRDDLEAASEKLDDLQLLSIISSGTRSLGALTDNLVPCDARLQHFVQGVRRSLNVRLARWALRETRRSRPTFPVLRRVFQRKLDEAPALKKYDRRPLSDEDVLRFIQRAIKEDPGVRHTPLLRQLRSDGHACEQSRFRQLFQQLQQN